MAHAKFVDKIAAHYSHLYDTQGFREAQAYVKKIVGGDKELHNRVTEAVKRIAKESKNDNGPKLA